MTISLVSDINPIMLRIGEGIGVNPQDRMARVEPQSPHRIKSPVPGYSLGLKRSELTDVPPAAQAPMVGETGVTPPFSSEALNRILERQARRRAVSQKHAAMRNAKEARLQTRILFEE